MKGTIALKYLEKKTPLELLTKVLEANPKTFGYCYIDADGLNPTGVHGFPDPKGLWESQDQAKEQTLYIMGNEAPGLDEDLQPWEMLRNSKNEIVAVGFFEGDFTGLVKVDSAHNAAYHAKEALSKKMKMVLRAAKDDAEALFEECKSEEFKAEILELFTGDGTIVLHFKNDQILWFANPPERKILNEFGMFSNLCGWEPPKAEAVTEKVTAMSLPGAKKKSNDKLAAAMAKSAALAAVAPPNKPAADAAQGPQKVPDRRPEHTTLEAILKNKSLRFLLEDKVWGILKAGGKFKTIENWYRDVGGGWPAGYDRASMMELWNKVKTGEQDGTWKEKMKDLPGILGIKQREEARAEYADLLAKGLATDLDKNTGATSNLVDSNKDDVTKKIIPIEGSGEKVYLPILDEKSVEHLQRFVTKYWDKNQQPLERDPTKLRAYEDKYPSFLEKAGLKNWDAMFKLPLEAYQEICKRHDLARLLMFGLVTEIERLRKTAAAQSSPASMTADSLPGARKRA